MAAEKTPGGEYKRGNPLIIRTDDNTRLELFTESSGVSSGGVARISNPHWVVRVRGAENLGWEATV